jgi:superoxide dismutase, Fe-Mn family
MKKNNTNRRAFIKASGMAGVAAGLTFTSLPALAKLTGESNADQLRWGAEEIPYTQQPLPYSYTAMESVIDAMTMEIHYSKHAAAYAKNLAEATAAENVDTAKMPLTALLKKISKYSPKMRNNGGGHYNHEFFWKSMKAPMENNTPQAGLMTAFTNDFGSFDAFKTQFTDAGKNRFGSGWAWLVMNGDKKLIIGSTPNQDNPLMGVSDLKGVPLLGLDVWEHAYYLKYQNKRADYINAWWKVVNWELVQKRFETI